MRETWEDRHPKAYKQASSRWRANSSLKYKTLDLPDRSLGRRDSDGLDCVTTTLQASTAENSHYTTMCPTSANPVNQRVKKAVQQGI
jgi:hypothetical protein